MKRRPKLILLTLIGLCSMLVQLSRAESKSPFVIDFIGFDSKTNAIIFIRNDWSECQRYTYRIDTDSLEIQQHWVSSTEFDRHKEEVLQRTGLAELSSLMAGDIPYFVKFRWDTPVKYYSKHKEKMIFSLPFTITVFKQDYDYYQCSGASDEPNIIHLKIDRNSGLVLINFQGDCDEGNWRDSLIYYSKKGGQLFSKKLTPNDVLPFENYKTATAEPQF